jgi:hypothetical protein
MKKFNIMTKKQLEAYGRDIGIELDRRMTKQALIATLVTYEEQQQYEDQFEFDIAEENDSDFITQVLEDFVVTPTEHPLHPDFKPPVATEAELAADMLAAMAVQSATAATHEANVAQADVDYSRAVQSAKDARGMADRAVDTQRQIEAQVARTRQMVIEAQNASDEATRNSVAQAQLTASAVQAAKDAMEHEAMMLTAKTALASM